MKPISTRLHGYLDYLTGLLLIASPWLFDFAAGGPETWIMVLFGVATIVYSLMTEYELGIARTISMKTHLLIDFINGAILSISPWMFGFADYVYGPHLILGVISMFVSVITSRIPEHGHNHQVRRSF